MLNLDAGTPFTIVRPDGHAAAPLLIALAMHSRPPRLHCRSWAARRRPTPNCRALLRRRSVPPRATAPAHCTTPPPSIWACTGPAASPACWTPPCRLARRCPRAAGCATCCCCRRRRARRRPCTAFAPSCKVRARGQDTLLHAQALSARALLVPLHSHPTPLPTIPPPLPAELSESLPIFPMVPAASVVLKLRAREANDTFFRELGELCHAVQVCGGAVAVHALFVGASAAGRQAAGRQAAAVHALFVGASTAGRQTAGRQAVAVHALFVGASTAGLLPQRRRLLLPLRSCRSLTTPRPARARTF